MRVRYIVPECLLHPISGMIEVFIIVCFASNVVAVLSYRSYRCNVYIHTHVKQKSIKTNHRMRQCKYFLATVG